MIHPDLLLGETCSDTEESNARRMHSRYKNVVAGGTLTLKEAYAYVFAHHPTYTYAFDDEGKLMPVKKPTPHLPEEELRIETQKQLIGFIMQHARHEKGRIKLRNMLVDLAENVPVAHVRGTSLAEKMAVAVEKKFPPGSKEHFQNVFLNDEKNARLFYSTLNCKLRAFFGTTRLPSGLLYPNYFIATDESMYLAEPTLLNALENILNTEDVSFNVKPHVRSMPMFLENSRGFLFGATNDGECNHHYLRGTSVLQGEVLCSKCLTPQQVQEHVASSCRGRMNHLEIVEINGNEYRACMVEFYRKSHEDHIVPTENGDGFLLHIVPKLYGEERKVLARYTPDPNNTSAHQRYFCLFEKLNIDPAILQHIAQEQIDYHTNGQSKPVSQYQPTARRATRRLAAMQAQTQTDESSQYSRSA